MDKFQKSASGMLGKIKEMEEFCDVTLVSGDNKMIRAHKVVLATASTLFNDMFQNYNEKTKNQVVHMRGVSTNLIVAMIDLVYEGATEVDEKDCDNFLQTLKQYKIFKVKSTEEAKKVRCNFYNRGYCKAGPECVFDHPKEDCENHRVGNFCRNRECTKRHRVICKYEGSNFGCVRGSECMFLHEDQKDGDDHVETEEVEEDELFLKECEALVNM